jgi:anti-sigma B factor antagonist
LGIPPGRRGFSHGIPHLDLPETVSGAGRLELGDRQGYRQRLSLWLSSQPSAPGRKKGTAVSSPLLQIAHETVGDAIVVHVAGEIDLVTAPDFQAHLEKAVVRARPPGFVVADLSEVTFLGSTALSVLLEVDKHCRTRGTLLRVVATTPVTLRPLQLTGLNRIITVATSLESSIRSA